MIFGNEKRIRELEKEVSHLRSQIINLEYKTTVYGFGMPVPTKQVLIALCDYLGVAINIDPPSEVGAIINKKGDS